MDYIVGSSGGNDSLALIQYMLDRNYSFFVLYNDTGWSKDGWNDRVIDISNWLQSKNIITVVTMSEGMEPLVRRKKGWPMPASKMQFCTGELKEKPTIEFLKVVDPDKKMTFVTGRRRLESNNRRDLPKYQMNSPKHDGRECFNPLYLHDELMRNELINKTPFKILSHQSMECFPCVCSNKSDLKLLSNYPDRIKFIEDIEVSMGHTRNEKPRTMFRPYRVGGGVGIKQAVDWGCGERGYKSTKTPDKYKLAAKSVADVGVNDLAYDQTTKQGLEFNRQCEGGYCGS